MIEPRLDYGQAERIKAAIDRVNGYASIEWGPQEMFAAVLRELRGKANPAEVWAALDHKARA